MPRWRTRKSSGVWILSRFGYLNKSNLLDLLRHTQATRLIANGVDIKTAQNRLGHASPTLTMSFYAHTLPENDQRAAALIGNMFSQPAKADSEENKPLRAAS